MQALVVAAVQLDRSGRGRRAGPRSSGIVIDPAAPAQPVDQVLLLPHGRIAGIASHALGAIAPRVAVGAPAANRRRLAQELLELLRDNAAVFGRYEGLKAALIQYASLPARVSGRLSSTLAT
jgi:hypothetical protein